MISNPVDDAFLASLEVGAESVGSTAGDLAEVGVTAASLLAYFDAQARSRHADIAGRWLQSQGEGFYTIGSSGHESNAAVAMALRPTDPALLHYRSGAFYVARAAQVPGSRPVRDILLGVAASTEDPISGGRHKVIGNADLNVIPQTSTIGSHLPRAMGVAFAIGRREVMNVDLVWPHDAVVVTSFGDAAVNHSTVQGALNAVAYSVHRGLDMPLLIVCEDNGIGISTRTPVGWVEAALSRFPGIGYTAADGARPLEALTAARAVAQLVRGTRKPAVLHLKTVRFMGHAGSDVELAYRSQGDVTRDYARDPIRATARLLVDAGVLGPSGIRERYELIRQAVADVARSICGSPRLNSARAVMEPLVRSRVDSTDEASTGHRGSPTVASPSRAGATSSTLAQAINSTLTEVMARHPEALIFGEDVARKGGVYGVTRGLAKQFGAARVFDTVLDEQTILGLALGAGVSGLLPIPEIQYLAYVHNAEDQLRGEAATLSFFSAGQYQNPMVVRIAGLGYQQGFGGHFHNDNSVAALRDIPGLVLAVPSHPGDAPSLLRGCVDLAVRDGRVCVFLEPIALYHSRDLHEPGDGKWTTEARIEDNSDACSALGETKSYLDGTDLLMVSFGNGVMLSLRVAEVLRTEGIGVQVLDLRWLHPLPTAMLVEHAGRFDRVLVVDETRHTGGVAEGVIAELVDHGYRGAVARVTSRDSLIPLGPAASHVLLSKQDILDSARHLMSPLSREGSRNP